MPYIPRQLRYTQEHEWVSLEEDGMATIGISDFAQGELGDIVFVELPQEGDKLVQMESFGSIEAVKTVSDLFAPVSGDVVAVNHQLVDAPMLINDSPYDDGWLVKVRLHDPRELERLLTAEQYGEQIGQSD
ncbi:MAG TPA: glycine cleavage system protein GcvH [Candidatus Krumholzibacteria bacterium]|nr:glycine cleavage system protein GcvH [Candidatus Krumholzibacteria bacterium]